MRHYEAEAGAVRGKLAFGAYIWALSKNATESGLVRICTRRSGISQHSERHSR